MAELKIQVISFVDDHFPGWVKCTFSDIYGNVQFFEEKSPVVTTGYLTAESDYPQIGVLYCQILHKNGNIITIDIGSPLGIETESGKTIFEVFEEQIISN